MNIVISIISWNYLSELKENIGELIKGCDKEDHLILYETGRESDHSLFTVLNPILIPENPGFATVHANSINVLEANDCDGLLILNPDILFHKNLIPNLKKCVQSTKNKVVIGAPVFNLKDNRVQGEYFGNPITKSNKNYLNSLVYDFSTKTLNAQDEINYNVSDLHGAFAYFPSEIIHKNGWMDQEYFMYGEENEYINRLHTAGIEIKIFSSLCIIHKDGGTFQWNSDLLNIREYYKTRNRLYNNRLFFGRKSYLNINYTFLLKYFFGKDIFRIKRFRNKDVNYFNYLGHLHFFRGIRGKVFDPNDYK